MTVGKAWVVLGFLACGLVLTDPCLAAVKGVCSICHTMHNSQQGAAVAFTRDSSGQIVISEVPFANLLKTDCLGCHSHAGAETIVNMEDAQVPIVFNLTEPIYPPDGSAASTLAGGNFHWVMNGGSSYGHNVEGIAPADFRFPPNQAPGGEVRTGDCSNCHGTLASVQSGCEGCHVVQHHADSADVVASRESGWYRFLGSVMQRAENPDELTKEGVMGVEAVDWEQNPLPNQHNVYQGKTGPYVSYLETGAIDQKCVGCHDKFHNEAFADSTWIRHPVGVVIPDSGEFTGFTTYNPLVPVARQNVSSEDAGFSDINRGSDLVSCVSCHRPHGSPYPAMLRWGYRDWPGNDSHTQLAAQNGCAVCHTSKS
jgi:hypothetical protein